MRTARAVGLSLDRGSLIVVTDSGEELAIPADDRLRAALRGDRPRLGQLEIEMESPLGPREIQSRIRSGSSLEDVARVAGIPFDRVETFAAPVLAERDHVAILAMSSSVRRKGETSGHRNLRVALTERLLKRGVDIDTVSWDSYRMEDGHWSVSADYRSGESNRKAVFTFDVQGRFSVAANDEARWVLGEHSAVKGPQPGRKRSELDERDLESDAEPTLDLSDELALVRVVQPAAAAEAVPPEEPAPNTPLDGTALEDTAPADEPLATVQLLHPPQHPLSDASAVPETNNAGWEPGIVVNYPVEPSPENDGDASLGEHVSEGFGGTDLPAPEEPPVEGDDRAEEALALEAEAVNDDHTDAAEESAAEESEQKPEATRPHRRKRASVPRWDDIMFGGPKRSG